MNKPLNILFISSWFPSKDNPTLGNFVESHAKAVSSLHTVNVIYVEKTSNSSSKYRLEERTEGDLKISLMYYKASNTGLSFLDNLSNANRQFTAYNKLFHQLKNKPDLVHANVIWPIGLFALWLKIRYKLKFVLTEHWSIFQPENRSQIKGLKGFLFKKIANLSSAIIPVSHQLERAMKECGLKGNYKVIPNTIDIDLFTFKQKKETAPFQFLHISTLVDEVKNVSGILRSYKELLDIDANNMLTIVSDGDTKPFIKLATKLDIPDHKIRFFGIQTAQEIAVFFQQSHAFILFSNYENLPVVIIEAFASGTPVISSNVGGIKDFFPEGFGYLIPKKDEEALLKSMINIKKNYEKIQLSKLPEYAQQNFSYTAVANSYSTIYKQVINN